jgi:excisionase family DNA binding protein
MTPILNIPEAAAYLHISRAKLYVLLNKGTLPGRKLDGHTIFFADELEACARDLPRWTGRAAS